MKTITQERKKYIKNNGKWFSVHVRGCGELYVRAVLPEEALQEAAERWGMDLEEIQEFRVREVGA